MGSNELSNHRPALRENRRKLRTATAVLATAAALLVGACASQPSLEGARKPSQETTVSFPVDKQQLENDLNEGRNIVHYQGNIICFNESGTSRVGIRPIMIARSTAYSPNGSSNQDYEFYGIVADVQPDGSIVRELRQIQTEGYTVIFQPLDDATFVETAVLIPSGKELLNSPELFDINANSTPDYNAASFNYQVVGESFYVSASNQEPVGVLLQGLAIS